MCGLLGVVTRAPFDDGRFASASQRQAHRGPDGHGHWSGRAGGWQIRLGHQRLAILDLSPTGAQPMIHPVTKSVLVYNGEIYNFVELRAELRREGVAFEGSSDTEVLLHALEHWGIDQGLRRLNGMWAFAWLDLRHGRLHLSRDRCGEKPLYWSQTGEGLYFASELKTLLALLGDRQSLNLQVVGEYLVQGLLDAGPETFFANVQQVASASYATFDLEPRAMVRAEAPYWRCPTESDGPLPFGPFVERLRERFFDSVRMRLRSDVPVGVLLSGGLDSSSIVGAAKAIGAGNLALLSSVSDDARYDESPFIDQVAAHAEWPVTKVRLPNEPEMLFSHLQRVIWHADAPVHNLANVAHYLLMEAAKDRGITVVLCGQGADELLCGYRKFLGFHLQELARNRRYAEAGRTLAAFWRNGTVINQFSWADAKRYLPAWLQPRHPSAFGPALQGFVPRTVGLTPGSTLSQRQSLDLSSLSVPKLNHGEDRMSMAWSREIRLPFLDPHLIELLVPAPSSYKLGHGWTKYVLRCAMEPYLPSTIVWRKDKQGFINPQDDWLKHRLRDVVLRDYFEPDSHIFRVNLYDRDNLLSIYDRFCRQTSGQASVSSREVMTPIGMEIWLRSFGSHILQTS